MPVTSLRYAVTRDTSIHVNVTGSNRNEYEGNSKALEPSTRSWILIVDCTSRSIGSLLGFGKDNTLE